MLNEQIWNTITKKWNLKILRTLNMYTITRFNTIKQSIPGISSNLLSDRLHELEKIGFVKKIVTDKPSIKIGYVLNEKCDKLKQILEDLEEWIISYQTSNTTRIYSFGDSNLIEQMWSLLKKEIKDNEYKFIRDKLLLTQQVDSNFTNEFDKVKEIIFELYGEDLGNKILQKLNQSINKIDD